MTHLLELWGGVECTVNRVGDTYFDQMERSGHDRRLGGPGSVRRPGHARAALPVLWERTAPDGLDRADWPGRTSAWAVCASWASRPIVGLVHHGSGPRDTSLLDPAFPENWPTTPAPSPRATRG